MMSLIYLFFVCFLITNCRSYEIESASTFCVSQYIDLDELVPADDGEHIELHCGMCGHNKPEPEPRIWYRSNIHEDVWSEVELGMLAPLTKNRVYVKPIINSLVIQDFRGDQDAGYYQCRDLEGDHHASYLVDSMVPFSNQTNERQVELGDVQEWRKFQKNTMKPLDDLLDHITGDETVDVAPLWSTWSACESCGLTGMGQRFRLARCRIVAPARIGLLPYNITSVACGSRLVHITTVTERLRAVPDFLMYEACECSDNNIVTVNRTSSLKLRHELNEGDSLSLVCPGTSVNSKIIWKRGLQQMKDVTWQHLGRRARVRVDTLGVLRIERAELAVAGYYSCKVAGRLWRFLVTVRTASALQTDEFKQHLGFLLMEMAMCVLIYVIYTMLLCREPRHVRLALARGYFDKRNLNKITTDNEMYFV